MRKGKSSLIITAIDPDGLTSTLALNPAELRISARILDVPEPRWIELQNMTYKAYLRSPEWDAIRQFMFKAYRFRSQLSGETGNLRVHHNVYAERGAERPRDLFVLTSREHTRFHNATGPLEAVEILLQSEDSTEWVTVLEEYRDRLQSVSSDN